MKRLAPALLALLPFTIGCLQLGQSRVLGFDLAARDSIFEARSLTAVAVGGVADLRVHAPAMLPLSSPGAAPAELLAPEGRPRDYRVIDVQRAWSSIEGVARIESTDGPRVRVRGVSAGATMITVETALGNDTITLDVAEVAAATLDHWLAATIYKERFAAETAFVEGGAGRFTVAMRDLSGRTVVGAGIVPPVAMKPPGAATVSAIAEGDLGHVDVRFDRAGAIEFGAPPAKPWRVEVIAPGAVTAIELCAIDPKNGKVEALAGFREGEDRATGVRGTLGDGRRVLLLGGATRVASASPKVCAMPADFNDDVRSALGDGATVVRAVAAGECDLEASFGELRARASVTIDPK